MATRETAVGVRRGGGTNVAAAERVASVIGGGLLALAGARRGGAGGALLGLAGAALVGRGAVGHCPVYAQLGIDTAAEHTPRGRDLPAARSAGGMRAETTLNVRRPAEELYAAWRGLGNLPLWMERVERVRVRPGGRMRWTVSGPMGRTLEWDAALTDARPGEYLAWAAADDADLPGRGAVWFTPVDDGTETEVRLVMEFSPPAGLVGQAVASVFAAVPEEMVRRSLHRFRELAEAGDLPSGDDAAVEDVAAADA